MTAPTRIGDTPFGQWLQKFSARNQNLVNATQLRNSPGIVSGGVNASNVDKMMRGTQGNIGVIPKEVADQLRGRKFSNFNEFRESFWKVFIRRGIPKILYTDNGKIFRSDPLHYACAGLGILLTHTAPYDPESKGKIERWFRTVQTRFYSVLKTGPASSLEELNRRFWQWLEEDYHRKPHSSLEEKTPLDVYLSQVSRVRMKGSVDRR